MRPIYRIPRSKLVPGRLAPGSLLFLAIDPGLSGALAILGPAGQFVALYDLPVVMNGKGTAKVKEQINPSALMQLLCDSEQPGMQCHVLIERVGSMPGQGVASMFSMGDTFGCVRAVVALWGMPVHIITPQEWKKHFNIHPPKGSKPDVAKEIARAKAIQLWPAAELHLKKHHNRAEALLMAEYLRHKVK